MDHSSYEEVFKMPRFDGSGPFGQGPMTGGARGFCAVRINTASPSYFSRQTIRGLRKQPYYFYRLRQTLNFPGLNMMGKPRSVRGRKINKIF
jgi:hypothetical protein